MADFCHDYDPGGLGCGHGCRGDHSTGLCLGDYTAQAQEWAVKLESGMEVTLGICEGHGSTVYLSRREDGTLWFEHGPGFDYLEDKVLDVPKAVQVPASWSAGSN